MKIDHLTTTVFVYRYLLQWLPHQSISFSLSPADSQSPLEIASISYLSPPLTIILLAREHYQLGTLSLLVKLNRRTTGKRQPILCLFHFHPSRDCTIIAVRAREGKTQRHCTLSLYILTRNSTVKCSRPFSQVILVFCAVLQCCQGKRPPNSRRSAFQRRGERHNKTKHSLTEDRRQLAHFPHLLICFQSIATSDTLDFLLKDPAKKQCERQQQQHLT